MASRTGPDLTFAQEAVENLQEDACIITRAGEAVLNEATGKMELPAPTVVYDATSTGEGGRSLADEDETGGRCYISYPSNARTRYREEGGRQIPDPALEARIPLDAPLVLEGDILKVVSSRRDPQLVGHEFRVAETVEKSILVSRRLFLEEP